MSFHSYSKWTFTDPIEDAPVAEIAQAVEHHGYAASPIYGLWTVGDQFIHNIGHFLSQNRGKPLTRELVEANVPEQEHKAISVEIVVRVLEHLKLLGETIPVPKPREFKIPATFQIPKINRPKL